MGGKASYDFQGKNHWRRWWANRIAQSCGTARYILRNKRILFLSGQEGGEGELLIEKGFSKENLVACDIDAKNTKRMREQGFPAITGDLCTAISTWQPDLPLHGVCADFCCSLNQSAQDFIYALMSSGALHPGLCVGINLMRGRDAISNQVRNDLGEMFFGRPRWGPLRPIRDELDRHRAWMWWLMLLSQFTPNVADRGGVVVLSNELAPLLEYAIVSMNPSFTTYKSGSLSMDSVVFTWPDQLKASRTVDADDQWVQLRGRRSIHGKRLGITRRKIAAMRAVTTMQCK